MMGTILFVLPVRVLSHKEDTDWSTECIIDDGHHFMCLTCADALP